MRPGLIRAIAGTVLASVTLLAASACATNPPGTDGNLANEWPAMATPVGWTPQAQTCHKDFAFMSYRRVYSPVPCTAEHRYETVHLGEFTGDAATAPSPPAATGVEIGAARKDCEAKASAFLGGDWRNGPIWIGVAVPSPGAWEGGARWYRCEVGLREDRRHRINTTSSKSLQNEFAGESQLKFGCYDIPADDEKEWVPVACTAPHNAEFVGAFALNETWTALRDDAVIATIHAKCRSAIAAYVGVPDNGDMKYRTGTYFRYSGQDDWEDGNRNILCHLWLGGKVVKRSLKGTGSGGLPLR